MVGGGGGREVWHGQAMSRDVGGEEGDKQLWELLSFLFDFAELVSLFWCL